MPYINQSDRDLVLIGLDSAIRLNVITTPGELNYAITLLIKTYLERHNDLSYQAINDVLGALEGAKLEMYRRVASPYENKKIKQNGDVY